MATVSFKIFKHHLKKDGTINVKLVVYHNKKYSYPDTAHYVDEKQITKKFQIKDKDLLQKLAKELIAYRDVIGTLGASLNNMSAAELGLYLLNPPKQDDGRIDFIAFGRDYVKYLKEHDRKGSASVFNTVVNSLVDYFGSDVVYVTDINFNFLSGYERYLRSDRKQIRSNNHKEYTFIQKGLDNGGVYRRITNLSSLFSEAKNKYNNEDTGVILIPHSPFKKYKLKAPEEAEHRSIPIDIVKLISNFEAKEGSRMELARDMFMLSFYLCGINAADLYYINKIEKGRINYNRKKTKNKRRDYAFISIKVIDHAEPLLLKWMGQLSQRYSKSTGLNKAIAEGLTQISNSLNIEQFDFYAARHTFATEARNTFGFSVADIGEALNHVSDKSRITDKYIKRNWSKVDEIQSKVVGLLDD